MLPKTHFVFSARKADAETEAKRGQAGKATGKGEGDGKEEGVGNPELGVEGGKSSSAS